MGQPPKQAHDYERLADSLVPAFQKVPFSLSLSITFSSAAVPVATAAFSFLFFLFLSAIILLTSLRTLPQIKWQNRQTDFANILNHFFSFSLCICRTVHVHVYSCVCVQVLDEGPENGWQPIGEQKGALSPVIPLRSRDWTCFCADQESRPGRSRLLGHPMEFWREWDSWKGLHHWIFWPLSPPLMRDQIVPFSFLFLFLFLFFFCFSLTLCFGDRGFDVRVRKVGGDAWWVSWCGAGICGRQSHLSCQVRSTIRRLFDLIWWSQPFFVFTLLCNVISSRDFGVLVSTKFLEDGSIKSAFNSVEDPKVSCSSPFFPSFPSFLKIRNLFTIRPDPRSGESSQRRHYDLWMEFGAKIKWNRDHVCHTPLFKKTNKQSINPSPPPVVS